MSRDESSGISSEDGTDSASEDGDELDEDEEEDDNVLGEDESEVEEEGWVDDEEDLDSGEEEEAYEAWNASTNKKRNYVKSKVVFPSALPPGSGRIKKAQSTVKFGIQAQ